MFKLISCSTLSLNLNFIPTRSLCCFRCTHACRHSFFTDHMTESVWLLFCKFWSALWTAWTLAIQPSFIMHATICQETLCVLQKRSYLCWKWCWDQVLDSWDRSALIHFNTSLGYMPLCTLIIFHQSLKESNQNPKRWGAGRLFCFCFWSSYGHQDVLPCYEYLLILFVVSSTAASASPLPYLFLFLPPSLSNISVPFSFVILPSRSLREATFIVFCAGTYKTERKKKITHRDYAYTKLDGPHTSMHRGTCGEHTHTWATLDSVGGAELARFHLFKQCGDMQQGGEGCAV